LEEHLKQELKPIRIAALFVLSLLMAPLLAAKGDANANTSCRA